MQKGLNLLLEKYSISERGVFLDENTLELGGQRIPVLPWESERRFFELRNLVVSKRVGNLCTYRIGNTAPASTDIFDLLRREMGILQYTVDSPVKEIFAIGGKRELNVIAETENGCVCTVELACTLAEGEKPVDKHEIITDNGIACDRVVDTQIPQSSIYVYGKNSSAYTDVDAELYGYSELQVSAIRNAFAVCKDARRKAHNLAQAKRLDTLLEAAKRSIATLENVKVG